MTALGELYKIGDLEVRAGLIFYNFFLYYQ